MVYKLRGPDDSTFILLAKIIFLWSIMFFGMEGVTFWFIFYEKSGISNFDYIGLNQCSAIARSIFPMFFQISPFCFDFCHFVMIFSKRKSGSFCSVALHKQPESAVLLQKSKQSWQKAKQVGDIWKNSGKMLQAIEEAWFHFIFWPVLKDQEVC